MNTQRVSPTGSPEKDSSDPVSVTESGGQTDSSQQARPRMPLGWMLGGTALILGIVLSLVAYLVIRRSESAMSDLLAEKGSSLLMVFESALRTGMRGQAGLQLQTLLEEMANGPDIEFIAVTMPDGVIIAHSNRARLGEIIELENEIITRDKIEDLAPAEEQKWRITTMEGKRVFLLYRHFNLGQKDWSKGVPEPTIFLGLEVSPFEITNSQNRTYVTILSVVAMLGGLACLLAIGFSQRADESRKRQHKAENVAKRLAKEVRRKEKLAAIGTLAAGVAHEIRNPLSSIKGYATYFGQRFPEGSDDREAADVMVSEVNRLNRVISDLLGLSKPGDANLRPTGLANVIGHVLRLIEKDAESRHVSIERRVAPKLPPVLADRERLNQALLNLCINALDAMPDGGTLTIAASGGKKQVCLMVRDTGKGIPAEIMSKIFDPYFTTKGTGTGLGLPMVHRIVRAHNGEIDVSSWTPDETGRNGGTIVHIWLPVAK